MNSAILFQSSGDGAASAVDPSQVTGWDILAAVAIVVLAVPVGSIVARISARLLRRVPGMTKMIIQDVGRLVKWLVYLIAFALTLTMLGVTIGWLSIVVVVILILGILMVKPMVENISAGLLMTMRPSFNVGDQIQTDAYRGVVKEIGSRTTILRTSDGVDIHIPNVEVADKVIEVYSSEESRRADVVFNVDFATDLDNLTKRLRTSIGATDVVERDPAPSVQAGGFYEGAIVIDVEFWYRSSHTSDSTPVDVVTRTIQSTLTDMGITPVGRRLVVEKDGTIDSRRPSATEEPSAGKKPSAISHQPSAAEEPSADGATAADNSTKESDAAQE